MGHKKFSMKRLVGIKKQMSELNLISNICVDWNEFNKIFNSRRSVVIECPKERSLYGENTLALIGAMRMAFTNVKVGACIGHSTLAQMEEIYQKIVLKKDSRKKKDRLGYASSMATKFTWADEIIVSGPTMFSIEDDIKLFNKLELDLEKVPKEEYCLYPKRFIVSYMPSSRDAYLEIKKTHPNFLFIDYSEEKRIVDDWMSENDTFIDTSFDIRMLDNALDHRLLYSYASTNHRHKFRDYVKFCPESVNKYFNREELHDLIK